MRVWPGRTIQCPVRVIHALSWASASSDIDDSLSAGLRILVHQDELGDRVMGVVAGYLVWSNRLPNQPQAVALMEHVCGHAMGEPGRELLAALEGLPRRQTAQ